MQIPSSFSIKLLGFIALASFCLLHRAHAQVSLPDVIIGEPNDPRNDLVGAPLSEKEMRSTSSAEGNEEEEEAFGAKDPISTSGYFQGDIVVASQDRLYQIIEGSGDIQTSAVRNPSLKWPNGIVPYVISSSFSYRERQIIGSGMQDFHSNTCIQFVPRQPSHSNYIHILKGRGCSSSVGRIGGVQVVSLGGGCVKKGIVIHEFMHAIGFWHEQSRSDRDDHVEVNWANIIPDMKFNFDKKSNWLTQELGQRYDYSSVMHYGAYDFALNPRVPTLLPKARGVSIGQRRGFSQLDIEGVNKLYKCRNFPSTTRAPVIPTSPKTLKPITKPTIRPIPKPTSSKCYDFHKSCRSWVKRGRCDTDPSLKLYLCKKSCGACEKKKTCVDEHASCSYWKGIGECRKNPQYMHFKCRASCGIC